MKCGQYEAKRAALNGLYANLPACLGRGQAKALGKDHVEMAGTGISDLGDHGFQTEIGHLKELQGQVQAEGYDILLRRNAKAAFHDAAELCVAEICQLQQCGNALADMFRHIELCQRAQ